MQYFQVITKAPTEDKFVFLKCGESKYVFLHLCAQSCQTPALQRITSYQGTAEDTAEPY